MDHQFFMRRCLEIAEAGRHHIGNGVLVGAVLVRDGTVIEEGVHRGYGKVHAERDLLEKFDQKISSTDILYTSLEPCCHHGKTPPCTDIIIERGIKNVVFGMVDPDVRCAGKGNNILRDAGVTVIGPVLQAECEFFCRGFISVRTKNRPFITLKQTFARDGSFANANGSPKKITNQSQDIWAHTNLRFTADGIVCGIGTILADNPQLNTRLRLQSKHSQAHPRQFESPEATDGQARLVQKNALQKELSDPYRIILDPHFQIPETATVVTDDLVSRTMIVVRDDLDSPREKIFIDRGVWFIRCPYNGSGFDLNVLFKQLMTPVDGYNGLTSLLIEGGVKTWKLFRDAGVVDEEVTFLGA